MLAVPKLAGEEAIRVPVLRAPGQEAEDIDFYDRNKKFLGRREGVPFSETPLSVPGKTCYVLETERK